MLHKKGTPKPSTLLKRALALFGSRGKHWIKGRYQRDPSEGHPDGQFCAIGSLQKVNTEREGEAIRYLRHAVGFRWRGVPSWNDARARKWPDVKATFNKAIKLAKAEGN